MGRGSKKVVVVAAGKTKPKAAAPTAKPEKAKAAPAKRTEKATPEPTNERPPDEWRCEWCGYINELKAESCASCLTAKSPVHPA